MITLISVIGFSNTGKTTFIEKMVKELHGQGYRTAVIKHDPLDHGEVDKVGSDTSLFWNAGSQAVALSSPKRLTLFLRTDKDTQPEAIIPLLGNVDWVILEGYKGWAFPKLVIWSSKVQNLTFEPGELLAVICDHHNLDNAKSWVNGNAPLFLRDDIEELVHFLKLRLKEDTELGGKTW